jgi:hypothetical protein
MSECSTGVPPVVTDFQLQTTATAWDCLMRCWANGVFIHQLAHRYLWISLSYLVIFNGRALSVFPLYTINVSGAG